VTQGFRSIRPSHERPAGLKIELNKAARHSTSLGHQKDRLGGITGGGCQQFYVASGFDHGEAITGSKVVATKA
jgi:hypothetical protein